MWVVSPRTEEFTRALRFFAGTRVPVAAVQDYLRHGYEAQAILEAFPDLDAADVDEAGRLLAAAG